MRLGWIGTGVMGTVIAGRLLRRGHQLTVWNRTASRTEALASAGATRAGRPGDVSGDIVFTMLTDGDAVSSVLFGADGLLTSGSPPAIVVDMTTLAPDTARELAQRAGASGTALLSCPVSGGVHAAEEGSLSIMAGGDRDTFAAAEPALREIGSKVRYVGSNHQALTLKIGINISLVAQMIAFSEGLLLAEQAGIDRAEAVEVMLSSAIASPMLAVRGPATLDGRLPHPPWFSCLMMRKDLRLALDQGRLAGTELPGARLADDLLTRAAELGVGDEDFTVLFHVLRGQSGLDSPALPPGGAR